MRHRSVRGRIEYQTDGEGLRGIEEFSITCHGDDSRRLRASCEMVDSGLLRDVFLSLDSHWRPINAHVHLIVAGSFLGTSHYIFSEDMVRVQSHMLRDGYQVQKIKLSRPAPSFGSHSLQNDAWVYGAFDQIRMGNHPNVLKRIPVTSRLPNGADGPGILFNDQQHRFLGEEKITVAAGRFLTRHYEYMMDKLPPVHYWTYGKDYILVKCRWEHKQQTYQLMSLEESSSETT